MLRPHNHSLTQDQLDFYAGNGYLHLKNMIAPWELERLGRESLDVIQYAEHGVAHNHNQYHYAMDPLTGRKILNRIGGMATKGGAFLHLYGHPHILRIAEAVLGPNFMPLRDAQQIKMPEYGAPVPWHRDPSHPRTRTPLDIDVYLDAATPDNGCLYVVPGSHLWQGFDLQDMLDEHGFHLPDAVPVVTEPGDIVLHSPNILHGSRATRGKPMRRICYFAYYDIEDLLLRGGRFDEAYVCSWLRFMLDAVKQRSRLPETADETPFSYSPTLPQFALDPDDLGFVERELINLHEEGFDPNYRYSPRNVVDTVAKPACPGTTERIPVGTGKSDHGQE